MPEVLEENAWDFKKNAWSFKRKCLKFWEKMPGVLKEKSRSFERHPGLENQNVYAM